MDSHREGYGDPPAVSTEAVLPFYRGWLRKVACGLLSPAHEALDDLVQEGAIALWRACRTYDPAVAPLDYWLKRSAHQRMLTVVSREDWTGHPKRHPGGRAHEPEMSLDGSGPEMDVALEVEDVLAAAVLERAQWAYHRGELHEVLCALAERERRYVFARFWSGMTGSETDVMFGGCSANIWRRIKSELRVQLEHLIVA